MKVRMARQIFSQRVASALNIAAETDKFAYKQHRPIITYFCIFIDTHPKTVQRTSDLVLFSDMLFASVNETSIYSDHRKSFKNGYNPNFTSPTIWREAEQILKSMKFIDPKSKKLSTISFLTNWEHTIRALRYIYGKSWRGKGLDSCL